MDLSKVLISGYNILFEATNAAFKKESGVNIELLDKAMSDKLPDIIRTIREYVGPDYTPTITSGVDGVHGKGSRHYFGHAIDIRTKDMPISNAKKRELSDKLRSVLGSDYYSQYEDPNHPGASGEHLHIQTSKHSEKYNMANYEKLISPTGKSKPEVSEIKYALENPDDEIANASITSEEKKIAKESVLPKDQQDKLNQYADLIKDTAKKNKIDPYLLTALISDRSGFDISKEENNAAGPLMVPTQALKKYGTSADPESLMTTNVKFLTDMSNAFGNPSLALMSLYMGAGKFNDALIDIDKIYAKKEFPNAKWDNTGIYKGKKVNNLPPKTSARNNVALVTNYLSQKVDGGSDVVAKIKGVFTLAGDLKNEMA